MAARACGWEVGSGGSSTFKVLQDIDINICRIVYDHLNEMTLTLQKSVHLLASLHFHDTFYMWTGT
uniref:Uncharacterized protein n=1 Tax=Oryza glumipatula TaxID=40148 RepID=A0A0E0BU77_9ORYZ